MVAKADHGFVVLAMRAFATRRGVGEAGRARCGGPLVIRGDALLRRALLTRRVRGKFLGAGRDDPLPIGGDALLRGALGAVAS